MSRTEDPSKTIVTNPDLSLITDTLGERLIVFVGMMGSGKTAIGRLVATSLDLPFYDSDKEIVTAADLEIPEIFEKFGESYFRSGEERVIQRLLESGPAVISLGGGAFLSEQTRNACKQNAITIWLKADADLLMSRVMRRPDSRPLLMTDNPKKTLVELMEQREPIYQLADICVESSTLSKNETRDSVLLALAEHLGISRQQAGN